jgi:hypothetical protein
MMVVALLVVVSSVLPADVGANANAEIDTETASVWTAVSLPNVTISMPLISLRPP